jgi:putative transposase
LRGYDYGQNGAYFVTICAHERQHLFGDVVDDVMHLNALGQIAETFWNSIPQHYPTVELDAFVAMPNHVHGILLLTGDVTDEQRPTLGHVIGSYKAIVTRTIRQQTGTQQVVWQKRYHDHIIRNADSLKRIRQYVLHNPALWQQDTFYG